MACCFIQITMCSIAFDVVEICVCIRSSVGLSAHRPSSRLWNLFSCAMPRALDVTRTLKLLFKCISKRKRHPLFQVDTKKRGKNKAFFCVLFRWIFLFELFNKRIWDTPLKRNVCTFPSHRDFDAALLVFIFLSSRFSYSEDFQIGQHIVVCVVKNKKKSIEMSSGLPSLTKRSACQNKISWDERYKVLSKCRIKSLKFDTCCALYTVCTIPCCHSIWGTGSQVRNLIFFFSYFQVKDVVLKFKKVAMFHRLFDRTLWTCSS